MNHLVSNIFFSVKSIVSSNSCVFVIYRRISETTTLGADLNVPNPLSYKKEETRRLEDLMNCELFRF